jgi:peptide/nickel transport system ATP-binding protein
MSALLQIDGLNVTLGRRGPRLLRDVSLSVARGEVHGLVGESGAGKSMIGKTIAGLLPPSVRVASGTVELDGTDLLTLPRKARRRIIGERTAIIPQDPLTALNPCRRIGGQITDRLIHILGWSRARAESRAAELLGEVAIREPARVMRAYPHELSGGMRQRVLIAAAFAAEPELIIADEPTTALDVTVQRQILRLIADMQARHGTALLFVTHDMGVVAKICQSVSVLYSGRIVSQGSSAELFAGDSAHAYARALIAATPRYDRPDTSLVPVAPSIIKDLRDEIAAADAGWEAGHGR